MFERAGIERAEALTQLAAARGRPPAQVPAQAVWHIDFDNGNDINTGFTQSTAIKTFAEFMRRVGDNFAPQQNVDVYCYGDNKQTDPLCIRNWCIISPDPSVILRQVRFHQMTPAIYYSGSFSAVQTRVASTNTPWVVTDTNNIGANQTPPATGPQASERWHNPLKTPFGAFRNSDFQRMRIVGGARNGAMAWTAVANGVGFNRPWALNGNMRTSTWNIPVPFGVTQSPPFSYGSTIVTPQIGDNYVVERLGKLYVNCIEVHGNEDGFGSGVAFHGFDVYLTHGFDSQENFNAPNFRALGASIFWESCFFEWAVTFESSLGGESFNYFLNCAGIDGFSTRGGFSNYVELGVSHLQVHASGSNAVLIVDGDHMVITGIIWAQNGGRVSVGSCGVWDQSGHSYKAGFFAENGGIILFTGSDSYGINKLYGTDDAGATRKYGGAVFNGGRFEVTVAMRPNVHIAGIVKDFCIGLSDTRGDVAVTVDYSTDPPTITTKRACTWDNLFVQSIAGGGFGGRVIDLETGSVMQPPVPLT